MIHAFLPFLSTSVIFKAVARHIPNEQLDKIWYQKTRIPLLSDSEIPKTLAIHFVSNSFYDKINSNGVLTAT